MTKPGKLKLLPVAAARATEAQTNFSPARFAPLSFSLKSQHPLSVKVSVKLPVQGLKSNEKYWRVMANLP
jgi:hypothetical protein